MSDLEIENYKKVGTILKEAREAKKLNLADIADKTNINKNFLQAIEENNFSALPVGKIYASGFIRTYASTLGLNPVKIYDQFIAETAGTYNPALHSVMTLEDDKTQPTYKVIIIAFIIIVAAFVLWNFVGENNNGEMSSAGLSSSVNDAAMPVAAIQAAVLGNSEEVIEPEPVAAQVMVSEESFSDTESLVKTDVQETDMPAPQEVNSAPRVPVVYGAKDSSRVVLVANKEIWIQVERGDEVLISRILSKGDSYNVPDNDTELSLRAGSGDGFDVFIDGNPVAPLGKKGVVLRGIKIDAEALLSRE